MFWDSPKIWLRLVSLQKLLCQFYWMQIIFCSGTKCLWLAQYVNKFLVWHKKFEPAQNILEPVKGQGIRNILRQSINRKEWHHFNNSFHSHSFESVYDMRISVLGIFLSTIIVVLSQNLLSNHIILAVHFCFVDVWKVCCR